jgi:hypothetical protein
MRILSAPTHRRHDREAVDAQTARDPGRIAGAIRSPVEDQLDMLVGREDPPELRVNLVLVAGHDDEPALWSNLYLPWNRMENNALRMDMVGIGPSLRLSKRTPNLPTSDGAGNANYEPDRVWMACDRGAGLVQPLPSPVRTRDRASN